MLSPKRSVPLAALRVPLVVKLAGANLVVVAALLVTWRMTEGPGPVSSVNATLLGAAVVAHLALVLVALRPIRDLEAAAARVWNGDFGARVQQSVVADQGALRVGAMFNILLDGLESDRTRMRALASEVIEVGDRERAALARELHDSTAQRLAALLFELSAAARDCTDPLVVPRLKAARDAAKEITEDVRLFSHTVHPRMLDDLGLVAALQKLARDASKGTGIVVDVDAPPTLATVPRAVSAALYRVAQEAVRNATRHAAPRHVRIILRIDSTASLEVHDDGRGFDLVDAEHRRVGLGLLSMRERVSLVDGELAIRTAPNSGTTVVASIPMTVSSRSVT